MDANRVREYYASFDENEWDRLDTAEGRVEFFVTSHVLDEVIPPGSRILDLGGGPGRYAQFLADEGHKVTLADLSPNMIEIARRRLGDATLESAVVADARDLSRWADAAFDAVVALGPFYHLPDPDDRNKAAAEILRVTRPGGTLVVAYMTRASLLRRTLAIPDERGRFMEPDFIQQLTSAGRFTALYQGRFDGAYGATVEEIVPFWSALGVSGGKVVSTKGIALDLEESFAELEATDAAAATRVREAILVSISEPSLLGYGPHVLFTGHR
ncbi:class I SAM-dependent methyltransferase [Rathayibacter sp. CAU 1779]